MTAQETRYAIMAATLTDRQRQLLRSLPVDAAFDPDEAPELGASLPALRRDGLIERAPGFDADWQRLTVRGRRVRDAAEAMA